MLCCHINVAPCNVFTTMHFNDFSCQMESEELSSSSSTFHNWNFYLREGCIRKERSSEINHCKVEDAEASSISFLEESAASPDPQLISRSCFARSSTSLSPSPFEVCMGTFVDSYRIDLPDRFTDTDLEELICGSGITALKPPPPPAGALDFSVEALSPQSLFGSLPIESVEPRYMAKRRARCTPTVSAMKSISSSMSDRPPLHGATMPPHGYSMSDEHPLYSTATVPPSLHNPTSFASVYSLSKNSLFLLLVPVCKVLALWVKDLPFFMPVRSAVHASYSLRSFWFCSSCIYKVHVHDFPATSSSFQHDGSCPCFLFSVALSPYF